MTDKPTLETIDLSQGFREIHIREGLMEVAMRVANARWADDPNENDLRVITSQIFDRSLRLSRPQAEALHDWLATALGRRTEENHRAQIRTYKTLLNVHYGKLGQVRSLANSHYGTLGLDRPLVEDASEWKFPEVYEEVLTARRNAVESDSITPKSCEEVAFTLSGEDLFSKWGFRDGDMFSSWLFDRQEVEDAPDFDELCDVDPLIDLVREHLAPGIQRLTGIEPRLEELGTSHNPIRWAWRDSRGGYDITELDKARVSAVEVVITREQALAAARKLIAPAPTTEG